MCLPGSGTVEPPMDGASAMQKDIAPPRAEAGGPLDAMSWALTGGSLRRAVAPAVGRAGQ